MWFLHAVMEKNRFGLVWLIDSFNWPQSQDETVEISISVIMSRDCSSCNDFSKELPRFKRKRLETESVLSEIRPSYNQPRLVETPIERDLNYWMSLVILLYVSRVKPPNVAAHKYER